MRHPLAAFRLAPREAVPVLFRSAHGPLGALLFCSHMCSLSLLLGDLCVAPSGPVQEGSQEAMTVLLPMLMPASKDPLAQQVSFASCCHLNAFNAGCVRYCSAVLHASHQSSKYRVLYRISPPSFTVQYSM